MTVFQLYTESDGLPAGSNADDDAVVAAADDGHDGSVTTILIQHHDVAIAIAA